MAFSMGLIRSYRISEFVVQRFTVPLLSKSDIPFDVIKV
jgi:hypothetical protein